MEGSVEGRGRFEQVGVHVVDAYQLRELREAPACVWSTRRALGHVRNGLLWTVLERGCGWGTWMSSARHAQGRRQHSYDGRRTIRACSLGGGPLRSRGRPRARAQA